jgi:hypothetical protein
MTNRTCAGCATLVVKPARGKWPKWCSERCRERYRRNVLGRRNLPYWHVCTRCGGRFSAIGLRKFCDPCLEARKPGPPADRCLVPWGECGWCGRPIVAKWRVYCSIVCQRNGTDARRRRARPISFADCVECGALFTQHAHKRRFCSPDCAYRTSHRHQKATRKARQRAYPSEFISPRRVFARDGWVCQLCGKPTKRAVHVPDPLAPTLDHVVPLSLGGPHLYTNVQCAHFECNWRKGDQPMGEQLLLVG